MCNELTYKEFEHLLEKQDYLDKVRSRAPLGCPGEPNEISSLVAFLHMPTSSFITGVCKVKFALMELKLPNLTKPSRNSVACALEHTVNISRPNVWSEKIL
ncbi:unnamed protein product [Camellia sinensis]